MAKVQRAGHRVYLPFLSFFDMLRSAMGTKRQIDPVGNVGYAYVQSAGGTGSRRNFEGPEFDLDVITTAYDTDAYVRQAVDKYVDLIFKAGWQLKGKDTKSLDYIKARLAIMAEATGMPTNILLSEIADSLVKYANVFIVKARAKNPINMPGVTVKGINGDRPVAGYFVLPPASMSIARDAHGTVVAYQQQISGAQNPPTFQPKDIIHIVWKKPPGMAFGVPFILPVLDDIRLLREIEDNVSNLLYKYLHPLYKFKIGSLEQGVFTQDKTEIEYVKQMIEEMPMDGTLILPERYDVEVVGAEGSALDASWALRYFEDRVFTGLGVPPTVFGRADTANRSTADVLTVEMHDRVKAFQRIIAEFINFAMIRELLLEGGFDPLVNPETDVVFEFNEIAIDERIKIENQAIFRWEHNQATFEETRHALGLEPTVDEDRLYSRMIKIYELEAAAALKAQAQNSEAGSKETNNKVRPRNQHGTKTSPKRVAASAESSALPSWGDYESVLGGDFGALRNDVLERARKQDTSGIEMVIQLASKKMKEHAVPYLLVGLRYGIKEVQKDCNVEREPVVRTSLALRVMQALAEKDIDNLMADIRTDVFLAATKEGASGVDRVFEVTEYRVSFIAKTQMSLARNYGYALGAIALGRQELRVVAGRAECDECRRRAGEIIKILPTQPLLGHIPPWHSNCDCYVQIVQ